MRARWAATAFWKPKEKGQPKRALFLAGVGLATGVAPTCQPGNAEHTDTQQSQRARLWNLSDNFRRSQAHLLQIADVLDCNCGKKRKTHRDLVIHGMQREEVLTLSVQGDVGKVEHVAELIHRLERGVSFLDSALIETNVSD